MDRNLSKTFNQVHVAIACKFSSLPNELLNVCSHGTASLGLAVAVTNAFIAPITDIEMVKEVSEFSMRVTVRMMFGQRVRGSEGPNVTREIDLDPQGRDSLLTVKSKIAVCDHCFAILIGVLCRLCGIFERQTNQSLTSKAFPSPDRLSWPS